MNEKHGAFVFSPDMARLNITWRGQNGDLPEPVPFMASDELIKSLALESVRSDSVPGMVGGRDVNFSNFVVDRFPMSEEIRYNRLFVRPKTPFGVDMS